MNAVDTNILVYAKDPRDPRKQQIAVDLMKSITRGVLLWQVACEFLAASRKLQPLGLSTEECFLTINDLTNYWTFAEPTLEVLATAQDLQSRYSLSFWDSLLVAACCEAGVRRLYTEDLGGGTVIGGVEIINPFGGSASP